MIIKYDDLCSTECVLSNIVALRLNADNNITYNYETMGRAKHLISYNLENNRQYYLKSEHNRTVKPGDIMFFPHGSKYRSFVENPNLPVDGIVVSFNLYTPDCELILLDDDIKYITNDNHGKYLKPFKKILYSAMNPTENVLRLRGEMYSLLDEFFSDSRKREAFKENYEDIIKAIQMLENHPEKNVTIKELADMCLMSESSFLRKFKDYSGGIAPVKYRNNIRLALADELSNSQLTLNEIAERLGFYDAAHLCKTYKQTRGVTLKQINK